MLKCHNCGRVGTQMGTVNGMLTCAWCMPPVSPIFTANYKIEFLADKDATIQFLRETVQKLIELSSRLQGECFPDCHCAVCEARHALAVTSGYQK